MITAQRIDRFTPADRSDTQLIPVPGLRPMPHRHDPRAVDVLAAMGRALYTFAVVTTAVLVLTAVIVAGALVVPPGLAVAGIVAIVALYIHGRAGRAR